MCDSNIPQGPYRWPWHGARLQPTATLGRGPPVAVAARGARHHGGPPTGAPHGAGAPGGRGARLHGP
jgi:hypothetical protein